MIGSVTFNDGHGKLQLTLDDDGQATCDNPMALAIFKGMLAEYEHRYSPAQGVWGHQVLTDFAKRVGGEVEFAAAAPKPTGEEQPVF